MRYSFTMTEITDTRKRMKPTWLNHEISTIFAYTRIFSHNPKINPYPANTESE